MQPEVSFRNRPMLQFTVQFGTAKGQFYGGLIEVSI